MLDDWILYLFFHLEVFFIVIGTILLVGTLGN